MSFQPRDLFNRKIIHTICEQMFPPCNHNPIYDSFKLTRRLSVSVIHRFQGFFILQTVIANKFDTSKLTTSISSSSVRSNLYELTYYVRSSPDNHSLKLPFNWSYWFHWFSLITVHRSPRRALCPLRSAKHPLVSVQRVISLQLVP